MEQKNQSLFTVPTCGEFNFTLPTIHKSEYILKAELHLWLKVHFPVEQSNYIAGIIAVHTDGSEDKKPIMRLFEILNSAEVNGYYVAFEVDELLKHLVEAGKICSSF